MYYYLSSSVCSFHVKWVCTVCITKPANLIITWSEHGIGNFDVSIRLSFQWHSFVLYFVIVMSTIRVISSMLYSERNIIICIPIHYISITTVEMPKVRALVPKGALCARFLPSPSSLQHAPIIALGKRSRKNLPVRSNCRDEPFLIRCTMDFASVNVVLSRLPIMIYIYITCSLVSDEPEASS